jgi:hypothetical protein
VHSGLVVVWTPQTFNEIVERWQDRSHDHNEAIAIDCFPASTEAIRKVLTMKEWVPSDRVVCRLPLPPELRGRWHLVSRARMNACLNYLESLKEEDV